MLTLAAAVVALNHLYVAVDSKTYKAIAESPQLRRFAPFELRTTVRKDQTYTGVYLYGEHTYIEFLDAATQTNFGAFGIGLDAKLANVPIPMEQLPITRRLGEADVPWFTMGVPKNGPSFVWFMDYDRRFLAQWHPERTPDREPTRPSVLQRYKSVIAPLPHPIFRDVVAIYLILSSEDEKALRMLLERAGAPEGVAIHIARGPKTQGITKIELSVNHPVDPLRIGRTRLTCDGNVCVWKF